MADWYERLVRHIEAQLPRRIRVGALAASAGVSMRELARILRRDHATTPYQLVLATRIARAKSMLLQGAAITDAAIHTGFADQSHFTRHFRRMTGTTPLQFVRGTRGPGRLQSAQAWHRTLRSRSTSRYPATLSSVDVRAAEAGEGHADGIRVA